MDTVITQGMRIRTVIIGTTFIIGITGNKLG
jgi:hypothetical protein